MVVSVKRDVLILVLMEYEKIYFRHTTWTENNVLILVLMEYEKIDGTPYTYEGIEGLNPCFNGIRK